MAQEEESSGDDDDDDNIECIEYNIDPPVQDDYDDPHVNDDDSSFDLGSFPMCKSAWAEKKQKP
jgi:hypothetical protein